MRPSPSTVRLPYPSRITLLATKKTLEVTTVVGPSQAKVCGPPPNVRASRMPSQCTETCRPDPGNARLEVPSSGSTRRSSRSHTDTYCRPPSPWISRRRRRSSGAAGGELLGAPDAAVRKPRRRNLCGRFLRAVRDAQGPLVDDFLGTPGLEAGKHGQGLLRTALDRRPRGRRPEQTLGADFKRRAWTEERLPVTAATRGLSIPLSIVTAPDRMWCRELREPTDRQVKAPPDAATSIQPKTPPKVPRSSKPSE